MMRQGSGSEDISGDSAFEYEDFSDDSSFGSDDVSYNSASGMIRQVSGSEDIFRTVPSNLKTFPATAALDLKTSLTTAPPA